MRAWQEAQTAFFRCSSICCRSEAVAPTASSFRLGTLAGGGGGGALRILSKTHLPRSTGEVVAIRRNRQDTGLRQYPAAPGAGQVHFPELRPSDPADPVMSREPLVQKRIRTVNEIQD